MRAPANPYPFGEWEELRRNFLAAADGNEFGGAQLERSGLSAAEAVAVSASGMSMMATRS